MNLFGRRVATQFAIPGASTGVRLEGLRTSFRVEHTAARAPSKATIAIYNASLATRSRISDERAEVRLFAGYDPAPRLVFVGTPVRGGIQLVTQGPDRILRIDATDGGRAFSAVTLRLAYTQGTMVSQVVTDILAQTGWGRGAIAPIPGTFRKAAVLVGRPMELIARLAARIQASVFVRDNALYIVPRGQATQETAFPISTARGNLIGSPVSTKEGVRVRTLIDATLRPGRLVQIRTGITPAPVPDGAYVVRDAVFTGDSGFAASYYVDLVCRPVGAR